jgi:hypothetical protein
MAKQYGPSSSPWRAIPAQLESPKTVVSALDAASGARSFVAANALSRP